MVVPDASMRLEELNALSDVEAAETLAACCGSSRWAHLMSAERPFGSTAEMLNAADRIWWSLAPQDWREAFSAHPRIGAAGGRGTAGAWSASEQSGMAAASTELRDRLTRRNAEYETRFGHIFIVSAAGKSAAEMLAILEDRLPNLPEQEITIAAGEQANITRRRLEKLLR